jgi:hypothetical protein
MTGNRLRRTAVALLTGDIEGDVEQISRDRSSATRCTSADQNYLVALGEPGVPVICWAAADAEIANSSATAEKVDARTRMLKLPCTQRHQSLSCGSEGAFPEWSTEKRGGDARIDLSQRAGFEVPPCAFGGRALAFALACTRNRRVMKMSMKSETGRNGRRRCSGVRYHGRQGFGSAGTPMRVSTPA